MLTDRTLSQSPSARSTAARRIAMPALLTRMSSRPSRSNVACTIASTLASSATSATMAVTRRPSARISTAASSAVLLSRSASTTRAPATASVSAVSRPIPRAPPVTTATWSSRRIKSRTSTMCALRRSRSRIRFMERRQPLLVRARRQPPMRQQVALTPMDKSRGHRGSRIQQFQHDISDGSTAFAL